MGKPYVGISGWTFPAWRGPFYPKGLPQNRHLDYASRCLNSIEINGTFYSLQRPTSFQSWYRQTPADFLFAVKGPQFITHVLRLKEVTDPLCNFLASGLLCLKDKLGPLLWQFPPNVMLKDDRFEKFLTLLPQTSAAAAKLARQHTEKVEGRSYTKADGDFPIRHAFEFRHPSFLNKDFLDVLRAHNTAFVCAHAGGKKAPYYEEATADFVYVRLHGEGKAFKKGYSDAEIGRWKKRVQSWTGQNRDVFVYFSNEAKVYAPTGAMKLLKRLGIKGSTPHNPKKAA